MVATEITEIKMTVCSWQVHNFIENSSESKVTTLYTRCTTTNKCPRYRGFILGKWYGGRVPMKVLAVLGFEG